MSERLLLALLGNVGVTLIVTSGKVFAPVRRALAESRWSRPLGALLSCSLCLGWWVGLASAWLLGLRRPVELVWGGGAIALLSYATDLALRRLGEGID